MICYKIAIADSFKMADIIDKYHVTKHFKIKWWYSLIAVCKSLYILQSYTFNLLQMRCLNRSHIRSQYTSGSNIYFWLDLGSVSFDATTYAFKCMHFICIIVFYHKKAIMNVCIIRILIELELSFSYYYTSLKPNGCIPDDTSKHWYKRLFCLFFLTLRKANPKTKYICKDWLVPA